MQLSPPCCARLAGVRTLAATGLVAAMGSLLSAEARQTPPTVPPEASAQLPQEPVPPGIPEVIVSETSLEAAESLQGVTLTNTAARDLISPEEVAEAGTLNLQEILRRSPSVHISEETGSDSLPNIAIRGVTGNDGIFRSVNVALFADGIPLAGGPYGAPGAAGFPLLMERVYAIDIQRGGGAVRYGPNNVSGIVNFLTRPIPTESTLYTRFAYDSFDNGANYTSYGGTYGPFGFLLESVYKDGKTYRDHGDYTLQNYSLKTRYEHTEHVRSFLQLEFFDDDSDLSDGLTLAQYQADPSQSTSLQNRFTANQKRVNYRLEWETSDQTQLDLITYYYETERTFFLGSPLFYGNSPNYIQATPRPMNTFAVQPQLTHRYELGDVDGSLLAGLRYQHENLTRGVYRTFPDGSETPISDDRFEYQAGSAFVQNDFIFGDWKVTPGIRFEAVDIQAENQSGLSVDRDFTEVLPAISASYLIRPTVALYANVQTSFQPPAANTISITPNPQDFEAQYAWMYELGTRLQSNDGAIAADLALYQIDYSDRLEPDPDQFGVLLNSGRSRHRGIELAVDGHLAPAGLAGVSYWTTVAYNQSEYENGDFEGNETPGSPHWLLGWGARYEFGGTGLFAAVDGYFVDEAYSDRENTGEINAQGTRGERPSATIWNAHTGLRRQLDARVRLEVQLDVRNIFDEEYFDVRAGRGIYPGAPFAYGGSLGLLFTF
ncbi:MAG: TonB-dependent receptor [Planctomycetes bacterium]|nr:TonB-dependent receptor [Planctomycetota bacterium]